MLTTSALSSHPAHTRAPHVTTLAASRRSTTLLLATCALVRLSDSARNSARHLAARAASGSQQQGQQGCTSSVATPASPLSRNAFSRKHKHGPTQVAAWHEFVPENTQNSVRMRRLKSLSRKSIIRQGWQQKSHTAAHAPGTTGACGSVMLGCAGSRDATGAALGRGGRWRRIRAGR